MTDCKDSKVHILGMTLDELSKDLVSRESERYRALQIFDWIYRKRATEFDLMSNIGKALRSELTDRFCIISSNVLAHKISEDGTEKLLLDFGNELYAETVMIPSGRRLTACLSTQSGCPVHCKFCATGQGKYTGDLSAGQIVEQLLRLQILADRYERRVDHIVFMGMGEPLLNYDNVMKSIRIINSPEGFNIGARKITISTVGIVDKILKLAEEKLQINLAISVHHTNQLLRQELIPLAKRYHIDEIVSAAKRYFEITHREITLEYLLLKDVNCSREDANSLAKMAKRLRANVNLIAYNKTSQTKFSPPSRNHIRRFMDWLKDAGVNVHLRASKGADIEAACGQLRGKYL